MRHGALAACLFLALPAAWANLSTAGWQPIPGAPDIAVDLGSLQVQGSLARVWIRLVGSGRQLGALRPEGVSRKGPAVHRVVAHAQFDCRQRRVRILEAQGYLGSGAPAFMSSVPSADAPLPPDESLGWTYDAVCEMARDQR